MRQFWQRTLVYLPLAFVAVGLALTFWSAPEGTPAAGVVGVGLALLIAYWLGRRSKVENTAVAVAQAVSVAVAEASAQAAAEARAQALNQVAVIIGQDQPQMVTQGESYGVFETDSQMIGLDTHSTRIPSIPEAKAPAEVQSSPVARILAGYPFAGAERVPEPQSGLDGFSEGATLENRGNAGDPLDALQGGAGNRVT